MLVSIIVPIYNVADYIEKCLLSVLNQTYRNIEVVLVNDCTPDNSMEVVQIILEGYKADRQIQILHHTINRGLSAARNTGIDAAKGEYIFFLDSDDWISEDCIERMLQLAASEYLDLVFADFEIVGDAARFRKWWNFDKLSKSYHGIAAVKELYFSGQLYMMACNNLVRRSLIIYNNIYFKEGITHEDDLWSFYLMHKVGSMGILNITTYFYVQRGGAITSDKHNYDNISSKYIVAEEMLRSDAHDLSFLLLDFMFQTIKLAIRHNYPRAEVEKYSLIFRNILLPHCTAFFNARRFRYFILLFLPYNVLSYYFNKCLR